MGFELKMLWIALEINPYNKKAKSILASVSGMVTPALIVISMCMTNHSLQLILTIKKELHLSQNEVINSNIISPTATLLFGFSLVFCAIDSDRD